MKYIKVKDYVDKHNSGLISILNIEGYSNTLISDIDRKGSLYLSGVHLIFIRQNGQSESIENLDDIMDISYLQEGNCCENEHNTNHCHQNGGGCRPQHKPSDHNCGHHHDHNCGCGTIDVIYDRDNALADIDYFLKNKNFPEKINS